MPTRIIEPRQVDDDGLSLIKSFETLRLRAYPDSGGIWTNGWGHTGRDVYPGQSVNRSQADAWLREDLGTAELTVASSVDVDLTDNQFAALVCFVFNVGGKTFERSTLLKLLNQGKYDAVPHELGKFVHDAKGHKLAGLVRRRAAEAELWTKDSDPEPSSTSAYTQGLSLAGIATPEHASLAATALAPLAPVLIHPGPVQITVCIIAVLAAATAAALIYKKLN